LPPLLGISRHISGNGDDLWRAAELRDAADERGEGKMPRSQLIRTLAGPDTMVIGQPIHGDVFCHDGRGPELHRLHWDREGTYLLAVDYFNPPDRGEPGLHHVRFTAPQVVMITPEEVIGGETLGDLLSRYRPAAMFDRGKSVWLRSFSQEHLDRCHHYQLVFYDQLLEVVAEGVEVRRGGFEQAS
jgi:hypothetical protein